MVVRGGAGRHVAHGFAHRLPETDTEPHAFLALPARGGYFNAAVNLLPEVEKNRGPLTEHACLLLVHSHLAAKRLQQFLFIADVALCPHYPRWRNVSG